MRLNELREIAARLSGVVLIVFLACSDDETDPAPDAASASDAGSSVAASGMTSATGTSATSGAGGSAGASTSAAGGATSSAGGAASGTATGGSSGSGGSTSGGTGGSAGSAGAASGDAGDAQASLSICLRLTAPQSLSFDVSLAFERSMFTDCRMKWVTRLYIDLDQRAEFLNDAISWNLDLWGCTGKVVSTFPLLYTPARISRDEAGLIVQRYIEAANTSLRMSPDEILQMRAVLQPLVQASVDESTEGFPRAACTDGGAEGGPSAESGVDAGPGSDAETFDATEWDAAEDEGAPADEDASPEESGP